MKSPDDMLDAVISCCHIGYWLPPHTYRPPASVRARRTPVPGGVLMPDISPPPPIFRRWIVGGACATAELAIVKARKAETAALYVIFKILPKLYSPFRAYRPIDTTYGIRRAISMYVDGERGLLFKGVIPWLALLTVHNSRYAMCHILSQALSQALLF